MGKRISLAVLLIIMIGGALLQNMFVVSSTEELTSDLEQITRSLEQNDYEGAVAAADTFCASWDNKKPIFEALFEHNEVDIISATAKSIQSLCISNQPALALSHIAEVMYYIDHIMEINSIRAENIF